MRPGTIVQFRKRDWVLLPSVEPELVRLRPLAGVDEDEVVVHRELAERIAYSIPTERLQPSRFPPPDPADVSDARATELLFSAARLTLRESAAPLRSLGRISVRPRPYQLVPLLMALQLDPVRLFIADDVGVGKTIEALLIARELLDRGQIRRVGVLCPPHLCDQWEAEMREKFHLDAIPITSSTISSLERRYRNVYTGTSAWVASIDFVKSPRNRALFLQSVPDLLIVDEAHGATVANEKQQQQRHELLRAAAERTRNLILLTATPHSGVSAAFQSLLGLLDPEFGGWDVFELDADQRQRLARHFVQRTRREIVTEWPEGAKFPERHSEDSPYELAPPYVQLLDDAHEFCREVVGPEEGLERPQVRVRYWAALALLRAITSSPAAAQAALETRIRSHAGAGAPGAPEGEAPLEEDAEAVEEAVRPQLFDAPDSADDEVPNLLVEHGLDWGRARALARLRSFRERAAELMGPLADAKLAACTNVVHGLLSEGFDPIVWCTYVATAEYVAEHLARSLGDRVQVVCVTGRIGDEERRRTVAEIDAERRRVLVATDCLSEGVNLQEMFTAVVHYDLPWNPNRLEQREGRVDRLGQGAPVVRAVRLYGANNPIDGVILRNLLQRADSIRKELGTYVPVPEDAETVAQALLAEFFFFDRKGGKQLPLDLGGTRPYLKTLSESWEERKERERETRRLFAQHQLRPEDVARELEQTDAVLGDPSAVRDFVVAACNRLGITIRADTRNPAVFEFPGGLPGSVPEPVRVLFPADGRRPWRISFDSPAPPGTEFVGRNHPFVAGLARWVFEAALRGEGKGVVARCGVIATSAVDRQTVLGLLRCRYRVSRPDAPELVAEEVLVGGFRWHPHEPQWLERDEALRLLAAAPAGNLSENEKRELADMALRTWQRAEAGLTGLLARRAEELAAAHQRLRGALGERAAVRIEPVLPPDLVGILVLQPAVRR